MKNKKTHCPHGHEYTEENSYMNPKGYRVCKTCLKIKSRQYKEKHAEYFREWHRLNWLNGYRPDKEKSLDHTRKWKAKNREKDKAHHLLNHKIERGEMNKLPCEVCGEIKVDGHHDDYNKPLEVRWLCRLHHKEHHKKLKELEAKSKK